MTTYPAATTVSEYLSQVEYDLLPEEWANAISLKFDIPPEVAKVYIFGWIGEQYRIKRSEVTRDYFDHLAQLEKEYRDRLEAAKVPKLFQLHIN